MGIFENPNYDFIKWRWHALIVSTLVVLAGLGMVVARGGVPLGIDFTGGTIVVAKFSQEVDVDKVRGALETAVPGEKVIADAPRAATAAPATPAGPPGADLRVRSRNPVCDRPGARVRPVGERIGTPDGPRPRSGPRAPRRPPPPDRAGAAARCGTDDDAATAAGSESHAAAHHR